MRKFLFITILFCTSFCFSEPKINTKPGAATRNVSQEVTWDSFEYFLDEKNYSTGLRFLNNQKKSIGIYTDPENLKMLASEEEQKDIGESHKIVPISNNQKLLITIWMSGQYHRYRIFNPSVSMTTPVCELQGEGDYADTLQYKLEGETLSVLVQEKLGKLSYLGCKYKTVHKHKN